MAGGRHLGMLRVFRNVWRTWPDRIGPVFTGRVLAESLRVGVDLSVHGPRLMRLGRHDVGESTSPTQPRVWTFVDFEVPDERADELAAALAAALLPDNGWYADFQSEDEHVVVFAGRASGYRKGDAAARQEVVAHGRAAGTPEHQLDWDG
jgi:hypothetical protein